MSETATLEPPWLQTPESEQRRAGYVDTLREMVQQPETVLSTCECVLGAAAEVSRMLKNVQSVFLTGSGSSEYAGDCVRVPLQTELRVPVQTVASGSILTGGSKVLLPGRPALLVSIARSGDSPESVETVASVLESEPSVRHLIFTCNAAGRLANTFRGDPRVHAVVLDDRTNDRSLVMTSSFTGLVTAARVLGLVGDPAEYRRICERLSGAIRFVIQNRFATIAAVGATHFRRAVYLAGATRFPAMREASLKMLEMTAGRVATLCDTYLGLRHGPMSYIHEDSLVVCFLSCDPIARAYELDLIRELGRKRLGMAKLIVGEAVPKDLLSGPDVAVECEGLSALGDENACAVDVVAGQILAFSRCLEERLRPDSPSESGVISRVVENFQLHPHRTPR